MRVSDLDGARSSYESALPIYREIRARLGEANCLQMFGLLELAAGETAQAFRRFLELLESFRELRDGVGEQAALEVHVPALAAMVLYRDLGRQMNDADRARRYTAVLERTLPALPDDLRQALEEDPDEVRQAAIREAEERLAASGRNPFSPPGA